jgi:hypothetical protein
MNRRSFFRETAALSLSAALLGACSATGATTPATTTPGTPASPLSQFESGVSDILTKLGSLSGLPAGVASYVAKGQSLLSSLKSFTALSSDALTVANDLLGVLGTVSMLLPPPWNLVGQAVAVVIPGLAKLVGLAPPVAAMAARRRFAASAPPMSPDVAWAIIRGR